jgi:hypothetical protein
LQTTQGRSGWGEGGGNGTSWTSTRWEIENAGERLPLIGMPTINNGVRGREEKEDWKVKL